MDIIFQCSDHIYGDQTLFSNLISLPTSSKINIANGSHTTVKGIGDVQPFSSTSLKSVLFAPKCLYNLIFSGKLTKNLNCSITFMVDPVVVQDRV